MNALAFMTVILLAVIVVFALEIRTLVNENGRLECEVKMWRLKSDGLRLYADESREEREELRCKVQLLGFSAEDQRHNEMLYGRKDEANIHKWYRDELKKIADSFADQ
ncbi:hypothetical protein ACEN19_11180 [Corynebacterium auriscanis]|uniref:hypothetical protein n=1 Tax=Corynebacterium auriscanis TaxID=99807 RepID=UPI003CEFCFDD